jgi:hypothetical protein
VLGLGRLVRQPPHEARDVRRTELRERERRGGRLRVDDLAAEPRIGEPLEVAAVVIARVLTKAAPALPVVALDPLRRVLAEGNPALRVELVAGHVRLHRGAQLARRLERARRPLVLPPAGAPDGDVAAADLTAAAALALADKQRAAARVEVAQVEP